MPVRRHAGPNALTDHAASWLLADEGRHNLLLSLAASADEATPAGSFWSSIEDARGVRGYAFRQAPYKLVLSELDAPHLDELVEAVATVYDVLPSVSGPPVTAQAFAERWVRRRRGLRAEAVMRQGLYALHRVVPPSSPADGHLRRAVPSDGERLGPWMDAFWAESAVHGARARADAGTLIGRGQLYVWEQAGRLVSMAGVTGRTPHGARVGYVYTPPKARGHGYATTLVAAFTQHLLDAGCRACFLYTDLANATSNGIYRRLGYRQIDELVDIRFVAG